MRTTKQLLLAGSLVALVACGRASRSSGLSVSTHSTISSAAATASASGLDLGNGIELTRIRMAVSRIHVEGGDAQANGCSPSADGVVKAASAADHGGSGGSGGSGGDSGAGGMDPGNDGSTERESCELSVGPFDVDLAGSALTGSIAFAFDAPIPDGTYEEIAIVVNTVPAEKAGTNAVLQELAAAQPPASILVDGFIQDVGTTTQTPFTFSTAIEVKQKREGSIVIGEGANVTLDLDPTGWFGGQGAGRLDPRDPQALGQILDNLRASIRLEKDDDHDGVDDSQDGSGHH